MSGFFMDMTMTEFPPLLDYRLDNGLRVILIKNEKAPLVNVTLGYKVGSKEYITPLFLRINWIWFYGLNLIA